LVVLHHLLVFGIVTLVCLIIFNLLRDLFDQSLFLFFDFEDLIHVGS
jgi:hypothetical protein